MSYVSLLKNIPEVLSQPSGIAAIASVGIHGAIALIVPLMPVDSNKPKDSDASRSVGILELSQVDQNRLPQTPGAPQVAVQPQLPKFPNQQQLALQPQVPLPNFNSQTVLPPLPPSGYTQSVLPPLPRTSNNYRISSLPTRQPIQLPKQDFRFDNSDLKANSQRFTSVVPKFESRSVVPEAQKPLTVQQLPELPSGKIPSDLVNTPIPNAAPNSNITTATSSITRQPRQFDNNISGNQNQISEPNAVQTPSAGNNLTTTARVSNLQPITTPQAGLPTKAPDQTLIAQSKAYEELRTALQQQYPNSEEKAVIRDTVPVSKAGLEGTVLGFLVVNPNGEVLDIKFQNRLVSPELELKTRQYFKAKSWKGENQISRYPFNLRFQDSSKTAGVTPEIKPSQQFSQPANNSSQPTSTPSATAKPLPLFTPASNNIQSTPTPSVTIKPSSTPTKNNQLSTSQEPDRELIQKLREVREKRDNSKQEK